MKYSAMSQEIQKRNVPDVLTGIGGQKITSKEEWESVREKLVDLVAVECYGRMPDTPVQVTGRILNEDPEGIGGKALYQRVMLHIEGDFPVKELYNEDMMGRNKVAFDFPINVAIPKDVEKPPVFLSIHFTPAFANISMPLEEIIDAGYAVVSFYYQDIVPDMSIEMMGSGSFGVDAGSGWGALAKWAWASSRVLDYIQQRDDMDSARVGVAGGSRLGKAALWAGVCDTRFSVAVPFISGTGGISFYRQNAKESIDHLINRFPYWFCRNYAKYKENVDQLPFDAHFLAALMAPRYVYAGGAERDVYDDTKSGYLACIAANPVYELYGLEGICGKDRYPEAGDVFHEGHIGFHLRPGTHFISRYDWQQAIAFRDKHHI